MKNLNSNALIILVALGGVIPGWSRQGEQVLCGETRGTRLRLDGTLWEGMRVRLSLDMGIRRQDTLAWVNRLRREPLVSVDGEGRLFRDVTNLEFDVDGRPVTIPEGALAGLASVERARVWASPRRTLHVQLLGGGSGQGLDAEFRIEPSRGPASAWHLVERRVRHGAGWERIRFRLPFLDPPVVPCTP